MTTTRSRMLRAAVLHAAPVAVVCIAGAALLAGAPGAAGAVVGSAVAAAFFGVGALLMAGTSQLEPTLTTLLVVGGYAVQVLFLVAVLGLLRDAAWLSPPAFAVSVLAVSAGWLVGLSRGHAQAIRGSRMHL